MGWQRLHGAWLLAVKGELKHEALGTQAGRAHSVSMAPEGAGTTAVLAGISSLHLLPRGRTEGDEDNQQKMGFQVGPIKGQAFICARSPGPNMARCHCEACGDSRCT